MGRARLAPKTFVSIPRLELVTFVLLVKISNMIKKGLQVQEFDEYFGAGSRVVLEVHC